MQRSQFTFVCMYVIHHTLISVGSLLARAYRHDMHVVTLTLNEIMQTLREWSLYTTVLECESGSKG